MAHRHDSAADHLRDVTTTRLTEQLRHAASDDEVARLRRALIITNMSVAVSMARRYRTRGEPLEDLVQTAYLALVKAVNSFDPSHGADLLGYVVPTVSGELKKHFRDHGWDIRPPRRVQESRGTVERAASELAQQLGRSPNLREIARYAGIGEEEVVECVASAELYNVQSLDVPVGSEDGYDVVDTLGDQDGRYDLVDDLISLGPAVRRLTAREQRVLSLRFFHDWTQQQIAEDIGVTQMQVSRILSGVLERLRLELTAA